MLEDQAEKTLVLDVPAQEPLVVEACLSIEILGDAASNTGAGVRIAIYAQYIADAAFIIMAQKKTGERNGHGALAGLIKKSILCMVSHLVHGCEEGIVEVMTKIVHKIFSALSLPSVICAHGGRNGAFDAFWMIVRASGT